MEIITRNIYHTNSFFLGYKSLGRSASLYIHSDITANCQLWCIAGIAGFLMWTGDRELKLGMLECARGQVGKNMLLLDIKTDSDVIDEYILKSNIIMRNTYKSTNGSSMTLYLIDTTQGKKWLKEK